MRYKLLTIRNDCAKKKKKKLPELQFFCVYMKILQAFLEPCQISMLELFAKYLS